MNQLPVLEIEIVGQGGRHSTGTRRPFTLLALLSGDYTVAISSGIINYNTDTVIFHLLFNYKAVAGPFVYN